MTARQLDREFLRQSRVRAVLVPVLRADEPDLDRLSDAKYGGSVNKNTTQYTFYVRKYVYYLYLNH